MRILIVSNLYAPDIQGGYEILCQQVRDSLVHRGHEVAILTSHDGVLPAATEGVDDDPAVLRALELIHPFPEPVTEGRLHRRRIGASNQIATKDAIARIRPDVIFLWSQLRLTTGPARAVEASGVPFLYTFNDPHPTGFVPGKLALGARSLARWAMDRVVFPDVTNAGLRLAPATCISRELKRALTDGGIPTADCEVLYQGIPLPHFPAKAEPGSIGATPRVLYAGQLHPYKGVATAIAACHEVTRSGRPVTLSIYGDGPRDYRQALETQAAAGPAQVTFHGRVEHASLPAIYRAHDVFVFPSVWAEPFGLTHLEAMASGTPVISTPNGGPGEFLIDGENALLFPAEDVGALASRLSLLLNDPELAQALARAGRDTVERDFTIERYVEGLEGLLENAQEAAA
jgi:glycosyltransferase involved in cell wall biosynthesis